MKLLRGLGDYKMTPEQFTEILKLIAAKDTNFLAIANLIAPFFAILATRYLDNRRDDRQRRFQIFKDLMTTRRIDMSYEHVRALNAIEIEFYNEEKIIQSFKDYFKCFDDLGSSYYDSLSESEKMNFLLKKQNLFVKLVHQIGKNLKIDMDQLDILSGGYAPKGWADNENEQRLVRQALLKLFNNKSGLPIFVSNLHPPVNDDVAKIEKTNEDETNNKQQVNNNK